MAGSPREQAFPSGPRPSLPKINSSRWFYTGPTDRMYAIVSSRGIWRWLSGVFLERAAAEASLAALEVEASTHHVLESIPVAKFPLFIIEDGSGFRFFDAIGAGEAIAALPPPSVDGVPILFTLLCEYHPDVDGRDEMGRLRHIHLDHDRIAELRRVGLRSLTK